MNERSIHACNLSEYEHHIQKLQQMSMAKRRNAVMILFCHFLHISNLIKYNIGVGASILR